jgi:signal transduction histidine kinase/CheY-like chemotaxis protein
MGNEMGRRLDGSVLAGTGMVGTLLVLGAGLSYRNIRQLNVDARWVAHAREVLELTADVMLTLMGAENGQQGFLVTGLLTGFLGLVAVGASVWLLKRRLSGRPKAAGALHDLAAHQRLEAELRRRVDELTEADRRKDEFLATLAHEVRNLLAPVRTGLELLKLAGGDAAAAAQHRQVIERPVEQMVRLVDDLFDLSRIARGQVKLQRKRVELAEVVASAVEISRPLIDRAGHELTVALPPQPLRLDADPGRMAQVLSNLLTNAAKYTKEHGHIWLTAGQEGGEAVVRVRDTGIGIPAEMLPHVFEMFAQAETAVDRSQGGLGIGLTLVKSLVQMHGGGVEAHSDGPGRGSEFVVRLPLAPDGGDKAREPPPPSDVSRLRRTQARRILVVDDNKDSAESLGLLLRNMGNDVRFAYDGPTAVEAAAAFRPDVVLCDIELPGMNGYEVARRIREQPQLNAVVLAALTGWGSEGDRRLSKEAGFDHHLVKPVDFATLQEILVSLVPKRQPGGGA